SGDTFMNGQGMMPIRTGLLPNSTSARERRPRKGIAGERRLSWTMKPEPVGGYGVQESKFGPKVCHHAEKHRAQAPARKAEIAFPNEIQRLHAENAVLRRLAEALEDTPFSTRYVEDGKRFHQIDADDLDRLEGIVEEWKRLRK